MATDLPPVTVATPGATTIIDTTTRRRPTKILVLSIVNGVAATMLAVLGYLQTINLSGVVSTEKALWWMVGINVITVILRQWFSPPETTRTVLTPAGGAE